MKSSRLFLAALILCTTIPTSASEPPLSQRAANAAIARWPNGSLNPADPPKWNYELGTLLDGMDAVWLNTADPHYFNYIQSSIDALLGSDGSIPTYKAADDELDNILLGRQLLLLYRVTQKPKYLKAAMLLYDQLQHQPRTPSGGFWHKRRYPNQMWLDGLYMAEPFYAEYASISHHPENFADITRQFVLIDEHARDPRTGLLYHAWDESKQQRWASKTTGDSPEFWARGMGWYMMALVDTIGYYPANDPNHAQLIAILGRDAEAVVRAQNASSGLWYEVLDKPHAKGNYLESSAACMFVYALAKGVRRGYLPEHYLANAERAYRGIQSHFIQSDVSLTDTVKSAGLGGDPYRDGTYAYYIGEPRVTNDPKGIGALLLASVEMENAPSATLGRGRVVTVDGWFNSQQRTDAFGHTAEFHYKWDTADMPGYSLFGHLFREFGAETAELDAEPTADNLRSSDVYVIASPDNLDKNPHAHFANAEDADQVAQWVKSGGVLLIMENDTSFADLDHFNVISEKFGIHFNRILRKHVIGAQWDLGKIAVDATGPIFHHPHTLYTKDVCTISIEKPATPLLKEGDDIFMAQAKYGKGTVFAMVDPWLYNEYTDGRKLPPEYDNFAAGKEFVRWVLEQVPYAK
jgi:unsaturated rhamnogalacturonyl hydrolase